MSELIEKLKVYGADIDGAMVRFLDDEELYESCLDSFLEDEAFELLEHAIISEDYEQAFDAAHTLKGVSGNMGLTPIYKAIYNLVEPLRMKQYIDLQRLYDEMMYQYNELKKIRTKKGAD